MKRILLLIVAAATVLAVGVATAAKPKPAHSVTISLSQPVVTYGGSVTLSGSIGSGQAGQKVDVLGKPYGQATFVTLGSAETATAGAWTYTLGPTIETTYRAKWLTSTSRSTTVKVRPQLTLTKVSLSGDRGTFTVKAAASRSFAGKFVLVQRLVPGATQPKKVVLGGDSSATFTIRVQSGTSRLRAVMPTSQAHPGYVAGQSAALTIHR